MKNLKLPNHNKHAKNQRISAIDQKSKKLFAKKSFGQNFLVDENYINKIISALNVQHGETIIEIGAGRGAITEKLIAAGANIIAIELERDMIAVLRERFGNNENFQLVENDALKVDFKDLSQDSKCKIVANLPYYISTAILQKLIEQRKVFSEMILMFQREVVERIAAEPCNSERGFLTVLTEAYLQTEKLFDVPPNAFQPAPKVWSAVVRLIPKNEKSNCEEENIFREIVGVSFRQKRKTLVNNLTADIDFMKKYSLDKDKILLVLKDSGIDTARRAETLTMSEWKKLLSLICTND